MNQAFLLILLASAVGSGLIAGVFFAFSTFVMRALTLRPPREGLAAMQAINVVVINPMFLGVFLGTAAVCAAAIVMAIVRWSLWPSSFAITGSVLYIVGTFGVTMFANVPLNNRLENVSPDSADAAAEWAGYCRRWTMWNHVRTVAATATCVCFCLAMR